MMSAKGNVAKGIFSAMLSLVMVVGLCPIALFTAVGKAFAAGEQQFAAGDFGDSTVVASGSYKGFGASKDGDLSYNYGPTYNWTLYESGLLDLDLVNYHYNSTSSEAKNPGWLDYASDITSVDIKASYSGYYSYGSSSPAYYYSTITSYMFSGLSNLTTVNAPYVKIAGPGTFKYCTSLQNVTLGTLYRYSGNSYNDLYLFGSVFSGCTSLNEVNIGGQFTRIIHLDDLASSGSSFEGCTSLATVNLTSVDGAIGKHTFAGCTALRSIDLSTMKTSIGTSAFEGCTKLRSVMLPTSTTTASYLASNAFKDCTSLEAVNVPSGVTSLSDSVFEGDSKLKTAILPSTLTSIGSSTFKGCSALATASLPSGLASIGSYAFNGCSSLTIANLTSSLGSIGAYAYTGSGLTTVSIPGSVTTLNSSTFNNCDALTVATVDSGVKSLAASCFANCDELVAANLPDTLVTVGTSAFANCPKLARVRFQGDAPTIASNAFANVTSEVVYPIGNEYWEEADMADYGGSLTWSPYGDVSSCSLSADDLVYSGSSQQPVTHLVAANGMEVSPSQYEVSYFSDASCDTPLDAADVKLPGMYYLKATGLDSQNCSGTVGPVAFQVKKAPLVVSYESETVDLGATPVYRITYDGFVDGEDESVLTSPATLSTPSALVSGRTYTLTPEGAEADNYDISYESGTLAVNPAYIDKPACASNLVYTGKSQVGVAPGTGYVLSGTPRAVNAGEYTATIELEDGYAWADGSLDTLTYTWTIGKATLNAAFVDETIGVDGTPALNVAVTGFVEGESAGSAAGYIAPTARLSSTLKPGFTYTAIVSGGSAANYDFTYKAGKVTVSSVVVEEPVATLSFSYNGQQQTALSAGEGYDLSGVWQATDAGTYTATATLREGCAWSDGTTAAKRYTWSIAPMAGSLEVDTTSLSLQAGKTGISGYKYIGDGAVGATSSDTSVATATITGKNILVNTYGEGTARITVSSSACTNYTTPASTVIVVHVSKTDLTQYTVSATGGTYTGKQFDAQVKVLSASGNELPARLSHDIHYYDSATCENEVAANQVIDAGTYWVRAEALDGGKSSGCTEATSFTIDKAPLTATFKSKAIAYQAAPSPEVVVTGFVSGESAANAKGYVAPTVTVPDVLDRASSYELTPTGGSAANYSFTYVPGTLTVKSMVVQVPSAQTGLTYTGATQTGVAAGEGYALSGEPTATDAGSYTATATLEDGCAWSDGTTAAKVLDWSITATDIASASITSIGDEPYTGADIQPRPTLTLGSYTLVYGKDYSITYENNCNAGNASAIVKGMGNFTGSRPLSFKVTPLTLSTNAISGIAESYPYTGKSITPEPVVTCGGSTLQKDVDYTLSYANNRSSGMATVTVTGKGNYTGKASATFQITKSSLGDAAITGLQQATYTGSAIKPTPTVTLDGAVLTANTDYTVSYADNTNVGVGTITVTGRGSMTGSKTEHFVIKPSSIATADISGVNASYRYTGAEIKPTPTVKQGSKTLRSGTDYTVSYNANTNVGTATITITGIGNYTGSATATFAITRAEYDLSGVSFESDTVVYDGSVHSLAISGPLPSGVSVSYDGNGAVNAGEHVVTATFTGDDNHESIGSMSATLVIEKRPVVIPTPKEGLVYTGAEQEGVPANELCRVVGGKASNAGSYQATASLLDVENYQWSDGATGSKTIEWAIEKATLTATYAGEAIIYGTEPELSVEVAGFVNGETASTAAGYQAPIVQAPSSLAGAYQLLPAGGSADNYEFGYRAGTLSIEKAVAMVVADPILKQYGQRDPRLTYSVLGVPAGTDVGKVSLSRISGENVGEYAITVSAPGNTNYRVVSLGSKLTITKAPYDMSQVTFDGGRFTYDGAAHSLRVSGQVPNGVRVAYAGNDRTAAGTYTVRATFTGDANHLPIDAMEAQLVVAKASVSVPAAITGLRYTGALQTGVQSGEGYSVAGNMATNAGNYTAVASLLDSDNYCWPDGTSTSRAIPWSIAKGVFDVSRISFNAATYTYDGLLHSLEASGMPEGMTVTYENNAKVAAGSYNVIARFSETANYLAPGSVNALLTIKPAQIASPALMGDAPTYTGAAVQPPILVSVGGRLLWLGTDYTVAYANNVNAGNGTVTVTGMGNYTGVSETTFQISPADLGKASVSGLKAKKYTGQPLVQVPTVKLGSKTLRNGVDFTFATKNNSNVGNATVSITGKGNYSGTVTSTFAVKPASQSISAKSCTAKLKGKKSGKTIALSANKTIKLKKKASVSAKTAVKYTKLNAAGANLITVNAKTGVVKVKKGLRAGTYKVKVRLTAAANKNYKAAKAKTVTLKLKVTK